MLENQLWPAEAVDKSVGESGESQVVKVSDLLRLCFVDFDRISPLKLSTALYLFQPKTVLYIWASSIMAKFGALKTVVYFSNITTK